MGQSIKISACMMVKNEEELLPQCLDSIKDVVDEIIVVDTGSEDRTVEIAQSYGAKVYHHPWENNFSKHRNQSISYATGDWILQIDADEKINRSNISRSKIKQYLSNLSKSVNAVLVSIYDFDRHGNLNVQFKYPRIYRNIDGVYYSGIVHNQVIFEGEAEDSIIALFHYGYDLAPAKMHKKHERTISLLRKRLSEHPQDHDAHYYLANSYGRLMKYEEAIKHAKKSLECLTVELKKSIYVNNYFTIASSYIFLEDFTKAEKWAKLGLNYIPNDPGLLYILTSIYLKLQRPADLKETSSEYLRAYKRLQDTRNYGLRFIYHNSRKDFEKVNYRLLTALLMLGENDHMIEAVWSNCQELVIGDNQLENQLLHNARVAGKIRFLEQILTQIFQNGPREMSILNSLIDAYLTNQEYSKEFIQRLEAVQSGEKYAEYIVYTLYEEGNTALAADIIYSYGPQNISGANFLQTAADVLKNNDDIDTANKLVSSLLQNTDISPERREFLIRYYYDTHQQDELESVLNMYLGELARYEDVPADVLLMLVQILITQEMFDTVLDITGVLRTQYYPAFDAEVSSFRDLAVFYTGLAEIFHHRESYTAEKIAYEASYALGGDLESVRKIGDLQFHLGNYHQCIQHYNKLLQSGYDDNSYLENLKDAFVQTKNPKGEQICRELLSQAV